MKILIFEGIATSGKTVIIDRLIKALPRTRIKVIDESKSHLPINTKLNNTHIDFFKKLVTKAVDEALKDQDSLLVFDRLYLTQAFRAKAKINDYAKIEEILLPFSPITVLLKVDEDLIGTRVVRAIEHRDPKWGEYVRAKGKTMNESADYYIDQQRALQKLLEQSLIPHKVFDTSDHNYAEIVGKIVEFTR